MKNFASFFVITAAVLWGVDGILLRPYLYTLPVTLVVFLESTLIVLFLSTFLFKTFHSLITLSAKDWLVFMGIGLMGGAIGTMAITKALFYVNYVNLSIVVLIQKLQPVVAIFLAAILLKEKPPKIFYFLAIGAIMGAYLMTFGFNSPVINNQDKTVYAALFALLAVLGFASSTVLSKRALKNVDFKQATYLRFLFTAFIMLIIVLSNKAIYQMGEVSRAQWGIFCLIVFITGGPGIFMYYLGLKYIRASMATILELAFPITAVLLEFFVHHKLLNLVQWAGVAVLFFCIWNVSRLNTAQ